MEKSGAGPLSVPRGDYLVDPEASYTHWPVNASFCFRTIHRVLIEVSDHCQLPLGYGILLASNSQILNKIDFAFTGLTMIQDTQHQVVTLRFNLRVTLP